MNMMLTQSSVFKGKMRKNWQSYPIERGQLA